jgi:hypothetical protein
MARVGLLDSSISSDTHSYACSLVHNELSLWGLKPTFSGRTYAFLQSPKR